MRLVPVLFLLLVATIASADQLIDVPTARKIPFLDVRYEFRAQPISSGYTSQFLGVGIGPSFELDIRDRVTPGFHSVGTVDFSYNVITNLPGISPGISLGVQDATNLTPEGRRFYAVTTFRNELDDLPGNLYADVTLGVQFGSLSSPFLGVSVPFSEKFYLIAEHSGYRVSGGFEVRPAPHIAIRWVAQEGSSFVSLSAMTKF